VCVKVTINALHLAQHGWNRAGIQYIVVNAETRRYAVLMPPLPQPLLHKTNY